MDLINHLKSVLDIVKFLLWMVGCYGIVAGLIYLVNRHVNQKFIFHRDATVPYQFSVMVKPSMHLANVFLLWFDYEAYNILMANDKMKDDIMIILGFYTILLIVVFGFFNNLQKIIVDGDEVTIRNNKLKSNKLNLQNIEEVKFYELKGPRTLTFYPSVDIIGHEKQKYIKCLDLNIQNYIYLRKFFIAHGIKVVDEYGFERGWFPKED